MVQPSEGLWLRQSRPGTGWRGRVRAHGNGAPGAARRPSTGTEARSADRAERQGADRRRASVFRRRRLLTIAAAMAAAATSSACTARSLGPSPAGLEQVRLTVRSSVTGKHPFVVEVARTAEQQERGLMFRRTLAPDRGMIFPYDPPQDVAFWMRNTLISLDMVFIRADGTIARITTATPLDETPVPSGEPIVAVLELNAGRCAELAIAPGDKVDWSR